MAASFLPPQVEEHAGCGNADEPLTRLGPLSALES